MKEQNAYLYVIKTFKFKGKILLAHRDTVENEESVFTGILGNVHVLFYLEMSIQNVD